MPKPAPIRRCAASAPSAASPADARCAAAVPDTRGGARRARRPALAATLALALAVPLPLAAAPVTLNLKDADVNTLVAAISEITGRTFVVDPRIQAKVSVISARPVDEQDLWDVFLAVLAVHGLAAIPGDKVTRIVPAAEARQETVPTVDAAANAATAGDQTVTRVIQVRHALAAQLIPLLRPLMPPQSHLVAHPGSNALIVSDRAANVERIADLVARVDRASRGEIEIVPLRHALAAEVVRMIDTLQPRPPATEGTAPDTPRVLADERANSVLLTGERDARLRLRALVLSLDTPAGGGGTQVVFLRYAKAKDLAAVLNGLGGGSETVRGSAPAAGGYGAPAGLAPVAAGAFAAAGGSYAGPGAAGGERVRVQADESANALVITAPAETMRALRQVVASLDVRRAQVLVEAVIAEVSLEQSAQLGVQWLVDGSGQAGVVGVVNFNNLLPTLAQAALDRTVPAQLPAGAQLGVGARAGAVRFGALVSALASAGGTNVLSTPSLVTLDNEEAQIVVGQNVPFVTGSFTTDVGGAGGGLAGGGGLSGNPFQTIQRQDVGLTLKVRPQINEGSAVRLEIEQEVSSVASVSPTQGPTTNKRAIRTSVLVEDGQILVLGGLIDDSTDQSEDKVPGLGDLPLLGELFRYRGAKKVKRNLMVFLHPVILRDGLAGSAHSLDKYDYLRAEQQRASGRQIPLLPGAQTPVVPTPAVVAAGGTVLPIAAPAVAPDAGLDWRGASLHLDGALRLEFGR